MCPCGLLVGPAFPKEGGPIKLSLVSLCWILNESFIFQVSNACLIPISAVPEIRGPDGVSSETQGPCRGRISAVRAVCGHTRVLGPAPLLTNPDGWLVRVGP